MLFGFSGVMGTGKTLNAIKFIIENDDFAGRPVYYQGIRVLLLDYEVCDSFQGFLYGVYWQKNQDNTALSSKLEKIDKERRLATIEDFPYLAYEYKQHDPMALWLAWFKKLASPTRLTMYQEALDVLGIDESQLTYDHIQQMNLSWKQFHDPTIIHELPSGCVALVDEVQNIWGTRQSSKEVPPDVEHVATHRHNGQDLVYISQDFKDVDQFIRRRLQEYRHYHLIGGDNLHEYFHIRAFDPDKPSDLEKTDKRSITRDANYYGVYLSSIKHTQNVKTDPTIALGRKMIISSISWIVACIIFLIGVSTICFSQVMTPKPKNRAPNKPLSQQSHRPQPSHPYLQTTATTSASSTSALIHCHSAPHFMTTSQAAQASTQN
ncbi:zonular occludens toxin domain-containing protein [Vibrio mexicanus]|uniref:zonular occludens toxin domain-containing protein n=1 Tax=Vibrio mexicanus TaxID=1004326 RepID=UPI00063C69FD|nr:zonular occludens toxin domain-containing protein [Vibrio mexicanus]